MGTRIVYGVCAMNKKIGWAITIVVLGVGAFLAIGAIRSTMQINDTMSTAMSYQEPTSTEIRQMCVDKLNELMGPEYVTPMGVNICVGTVLDGLNK